LIQFVDSIRSTVSTIFCYYQCDLVIVIVIVIVIVTKKTCSGISRSVLEGSLCLIAIDMHA